MRRFLIFGVLIGAALVAALLHGGRPERRYKNSFCQYNIAYNDTGPMGFVSYGGSLVMTATDAHDLNALLDARGGDHLPAYDGAHAYFSPIKEYVLLRDLLEHRTPRSVVIMIRPRNIERPGAHDEAIEIARLSDLGLVLAASWSDSPAIALRNAAEIVFRHLRAFDVATPDNWRLTKGETTRNCHRGDYRLDIDAMTMAADIRASLDGTPREWDITDDAEAFNRTVIAAIKALTEAHGVDLFFLMMPTTQTALPRPEFAAEFEAVTGTKILIMDQWMHDLLSEMGRRDNGHTNAPGRVHFLPWLVDEITRRCDNPAGCF